MYTNQKALRTAAAAALEARGYAIDPVSGSGGARLRLMKDGVSSLALVRTSSDRWVGWMRTETGEWRGMDAGEMVVVAALNAAQPTIADVYALAPADVRSAFDLNLASREAKMPNLKKTAPIFVSLDKDNRNVPTAAGSGMKLKARWTAQIPLGAHQSTSSPSGVEKQAVDLTSAPQPSGQVGCLLDQCRDQLAAILGVDRAQIDLQLKVAW